MSDPGFFVPAPAPQVLGDDEIHIWFCEFSSGDPSTHRQSAQRFLRRLLAAYCGCESDELVFVTGAHGKPALADAALAFNLSHCGTGAVLAIARGVDVGVDLECPSRPRPHAALALRYFCRREAEAVAAASGGAREATFLRLWTAKEAVLKALGRGLAFGLDRLEFDPATEPPTLRWIAPDGGASPAWQVRALPLARPFLGHLAWCGEPRRLRAFRAAASSLPTAQE